MIRIACKRLADRLVMCASLTTLLLTEAVGCSFAGQPILPIQTQHRLESSAGTADDHLAAARLYQKESLRAQAEANKYEQAAASIRPIEDTKGFRRSALIMAAQTNQQYAGEMQKLYAAHLTKAETMMGKQQLQ